MSTLISCTKDKADTNGYYVDYNPDIVLSAGDSLSLDVDNNSTDDVLVYVVDPSNIYLTMLNTEYTVSIGNFIANLIHTIRTIVNNDPTFFGTDMPFSLGNSIVSSPNTIQYLDPEGYTMTSPTAISDAYQCWNEIANYEITKVFSNNGFRAAIFLYTPSVGATNYNMAKWIVLLYHQEGMLNLPNLNASDVICTPNPFNESIQINTDLNGLDYKICSSSGEILKSGKCFDGNIDGLSHFSSGLYFLEVVKNEQTTIRKLIKN